LLSKTGHEIKPDCGEVRGAGAAMILTPDVDVKAFEANAGSELEQQLLQHK
jgi:hypothetical protein